MSTRRLDLTSSVYDYIERLAPPELPVLSRLRAETAELPEAGMQIGADQGQFMMLLVKLMSARRAIEIGVFTGYSSICIALALGESGALVSCDVSERYTAIARRYFREAGVEERIDLRLRPALETLAELRQTPTWGTLDFAFIDADKENGPAYYDACVELVRPGGLVVVDNALWGGSVARPTDERASTAAMREVNRRAFSDRRVEASLLTLGDGLLLVRKR